MHFNTLISATLAVSSLLSTGVLARPHGQSLHAHRNAHRSSPLYPKYAPGAHAAAKQKRDAPMQQLSGEASSFTAWMQGFIKNGSTSAASLSALQDEVSSHVQAIHDFVSKEGSSTSVSTSTLDSLQTDADAFKVWIDTWVQDTSAMSSADAMNQLSNEMVSYRGWLNQWLGTGGPSSATAAGGVTTYLTTTAFQTSTATVFTTQIITGTPPAAASSTTQAPAPSLPAPGTSLIPRPVSGPSSSSEVPVVSPPAASSSATASSQAIPPSPTSSPSGGSNGGLKLTAWWGQAPIASTYSLQQVCEDDSFDTVMLSFLNDYFVGSGKMPNLNLGPLTGPASPAQTAAGATGLFDGSKLVPAIQACQNSGKKVMLTLGGAKDFSNSSFTDDGQAQQFASTLWDLFLGGQSPLRPFGSIKLDGIDVDNEDKDQTGYNALVAALRSQYAQDTSKQYYLSGAPQCIRPDASIPLDAMRQMDFVWVQFYNNPSCNHGSTGFADSVKAWSDDLAGTNAKLYIGAIGDVSQGSGYLDANTLAQEVAQVKAMGLDNLGGYALWDASFAMENSFQQPIKAALN